MALAAPVVIAGVDRRDGAEAGLVGDAHDVLVEFEGHVAMGVGTVAAGVGAVNALKAHEGGNEVGHGEGRLG